LKENRYGEEAGEGSERRRLAGSVTRRCDHVMLMLCLLRWLPVCLRADFKVATLVHRSLSGNLPSYLADDCRLIADACERRIPCSTLHREPSMTVSLHGPTDLQLPESDYGTVYHHISEIRTYRKVGSGGH